MVKRSLLALMFIGVLFSCEPENGAGINKFTDAGLRKISEYRDRRLSDSLYRFFRHPNADYRRDAVIAFASIQDSMAIHQLGRVLFQDADSSVRMCAAFAIGQTSSSESERILLAAINREKNAAVLNELLEAYGRSTIHWQLVNPAFFHDTIESAGLAWSIYRAGLNGRTDSSANRVAADLLSRRYNARTRLGAAHYFSRSAKDPDPHLDRLTIAATTDPIAEVRMAATNALRKIRSEASLATIKSILANERDHRVRVNAVRALQGFEFTDTRDELFRALKDKQSHVGVTASEVLKAMASADNWMEIANTTVNVKHWRIRANLYEAALKSSGNKSLADEMINLYRQSIEPYEKAALVTALQSYLPAFEFIEQELVNTPTPVIRTACAAALAGMNYNKGFSPQYKEKYVNLIKQSIPKNDPSTIAALVSPLGNPEANYRAVVADAAFLKDAREKMSLPEDFEAVEVLDKAIAYLQGTSPKRLVNEFNHPLDWEHIGTIAVDQVVVIKTSRGDIRIRLFVEEAPGSVSNFLKLAASGYYNKKPIHRVVPNFVIQGGCKRGDGSGGEDYSIRSEYSTRRYTTGSVGMASAGKDTEGTQWFITHSPTPHLDGRYTIFGEVIEGMEVVNLIEMGDMVRSVEIAK